MSFDLTCNEIEEQGSRRVVLIVPKQYVKTVKTALERHRKLDQTIKISPETHQEPRDDANEQDIPGDQAHHAPPNRMRVATTVPYEPCHQTMATYQEALLLEITNDLNITQISNNISISYHEPSVSATPPTSKNPLHKALDGALSDLPDTIFTTANITRDALTSSVPDGYSVYPPLLLLPHNALASPAWTSLLTTHASTSPALQPLWSTLASAMNVTHIAINSPIPPTQTSLSSTENILRSPLNITPLFGDFGTLPTEVTKSNPTQQDFDNAFWVSTIQNGIHQVWAPLYTMFSRGNIREKTRVLQFPSPSGDDKEAVVDMYSGIGYFSFSYKAAGFKPIFCFEINAWSVEGLRRGAVRNGWSYKIYTEDDIKGQTVHIGDGGVDFHIFPLSNSHVLPILSSLFSSPTFPPIRHANLGLLPHSRDAWKDSVALVDKKMGGWIHAHENVGVGEMEEREGEVEGMFQGYLDETRMGRKARVEHVERVKMYAPGVVHVVFDVRIDGVEEVGES